MSSYSDCRKRDDIDDGTSRRLLMFAGRVYVQLLLNFVAGEWDVYIRYQFIM